MRVGISDYGCALPRFRLEAATVQGACLEAPRSWNWSAVPWADEDALTLAIEAMRSRPPREHVRQLAVASTLLPYAERVQGGLLLQATGLEHDVLLTEHTGSARAATEALRQLTARPPQEGEEAMLVATDPGPRDVHDVDRSAGAVVLHVSADARVAHFDAWGHDVVEAPGIDFVPQWQGSRHDIKVADYAREAYVESICRAAGVVMRSTGTDVHDFRWIVLGGVQVDLASRGAKALGARKEQWHAVQPYGLIGDAGAAGVLFGLVAALDRSMPGERILMVSHGSGAATDVAALTAAEACGQDRFAAAASGGISLTMPRYRALKGT